MKGSGGQHVVFGSGDPECFSCLAGGSFPPQGFPPVVVNDAAPAGRAYLIPPQGRYESTLAWLSRCAVIMNLKT